MARVRSFLAGCLALALLGPSLAFGQAKPVADAPAAVSKPVVATPSVKGPSFPALSGRVVDAANLLSPEVEAQLSARLQALEATSSDQLVVATVPSLQGYEIEEYGYRLGRAWQIGQGERLNNGVILLVAPNERKVRIEVGYGLEGVLTDFLTGQVIRNDILPAFKAGDMQGGIVAGADGLIGLLTLDRAELQARAARGLASVNAQNDNDVRPAAVFFIILFIGLWVVAATLSTRNARFRRAGRGGLDDIHEWNKAAIAADVASVVLQVLLSGGRGGGDGGGGGGGFGGGGGSFGGGGSSGSW
ncbi:MAG: hypothetical protein RL186_1435 [Pseudomonadota bacterium]